MPALAGVVAVAPPPHNAVMGLFDRIFGRKSRTPRRWSPPASQLENPGILLLLTEPLDLDADAVCRDLAAIEPLKLAPRYATNLAPDDKPPTENTRGIFMGRFAFDSHEIDVVGLNAPVPESVLQQTVEASAWTGQGRQAMLEHRAHVVLLHRGGGASPLEKHLALFKLAAVLAGPRCAGVLHEAAWTCAPAQVVREFAKPEMLKACREQIPPIVFTGFVKFLDDDTVWFVSKGHHLFGVPDFVLRGTPEDKPGDILDLFMNIFLYVISSRRELAAGHTMQIAEEVFLRFGELDTGHNPALAGPGRTLTIARIGRDEINRG